jgi:putative flippase GtrA
MEIDSRAVTTRDYKIAFAAGTASGVLWFFVLTRLSMLPGERLVTALCSLPIFFVAGVAVANRFFHRQLVHKLVKFIIVGVLNTSIDFFVFNMLMSATGTDKGISVTLFKTVSFLSALFNSYGLNRLWTFDGEGAPSWTGQELMRFAAVTVSGLLVNVGTTSLIVNATNAPFGLSQVRWDNLAALVASASNLIWNFAGYKLFVFTSPQRVSQASESCGRPPREA